MKKGRPKSVTKQEQHYALEYAHRVNELLHSDLPSTWFYKHEIYEIANVATALLITYDRQRDDEFKVYTKVQWNRFLRRMTRVKADWADVRLDYMKELGHHPQKIMGGWEGRTIYFIRGGNNPEFWTSRQAEKDTLVLLKSVAGVWGDIVSEEVNRIGELIPVGRKHFRDYEHQVRVAINYLFFGDLGEAIPQIRTEPGNEGSEIRDLICQNRADSGFWKDLKDKYSCSEVLFEVKNTNRLTRNNLRQVYCYLKPALGLWGFVVRRATQPEKIQAYNRTLFKNFGQKRGVLVLTDDDLRRMVDMKLRGTDPSDYMRDRWSEFITSI